MFTQILADFADKMQYYCFLSAKSAFICENLREIPV